VALARVSVPVNGALSLRLWSARSEAAVTHTTADLNLRADPAMSQHIPAGAVINNTFGLFAETYDEWSIKSEAISRRKALSVIGLAGALGLATLALTESEADAQETTAPPATSPTTSTGAGTPGMKRRQQRRAGRHERRHERRTGQPPKPATNPPQ
jgi:hypothetical protein